MYVFKHFRDIGDIRISVHYLFVCNEIFSILHWEVNIIHTLHFSINKLFGQELFYSRIIKCVTLFYLINIYGYTVNGERHHPECEFAIFIVAEIFGNEIFEKLASLRAILLINFYINISQFARRTVRDGTEPAAYLERNFIFIKRVN